MKLALCMLIASCGMQLAHSQDFLDLLPAIRSPQLVFPPGFQVINTVPLSAINSPAGTGGNPVAPADPVATEAQAPPEGPRSARQTGRGRLIEIAPGVFIRVVNGTDPQDDDDPQDPPPSDEENDIAPPRPNRPNNRPGSRRPIRPIRVNVRAPGRRRRPSRPSNTRRIRPIRVNIRAPTSRDVPSGGYGSGGDGGYGGRQSFEIVRANRIGDFELDSPSGQPSSGYQGQSQFSNGNFPSLTNTAPGNFPLITADPARDEPLDDEDYEDEEPVDEEPVEDEEPEEPPTTTRRPPRRRGNGRRVRISVLRPPTRISPRGQ